MSTKPANLRTAMPLVTTWIDDLRAAFGVDDINAVIKAGVSGLPGFYASEAGHQVGTRPVQSGTEVGATQMVILVPKK
jgi:hypothetical protein